MTTSSDGGSDPKDEKPEKWTDRLKDALTGGSADQSAEGSSDEATAATRRAEREASDTETPRPGADKAGGPVSEPGASNLEPDRDLDDDRGSVGRPATGGPAGADPVDRTVAGRGFQAEPSARPTWPGPSAASSVGQAGSAGRGREDRTSWAGPTAAGSASGGTASGGAWGGDEERPSWAGPTVSGSGSDLSDQASRPIPTTSSASGSAIPLGADTSATDPSRESTPAATVDSATTPASRQAATDSVTGPSATASDTAPSTPETPATETTPIGRATTAGTTTDGDAIDGKATGPSFTDETTPPRGVSEARPATPSVGSESGTTDADGPTPAGSPPASSSSSPLTAVTPLPTSEDDIYRPAESRDPSVREDYVHADADRKATEATKSAGAAGTLDEADRTAPAPVTSITSGRRRSDAAPDAVDGRTDVTTDTEWRELQANFVDDPEATVSEAATLIERDLAGLRAKLAGGSTEDLRNAFKRYRSLHESLR
ncbi:hypothetical protein [Kineosporia babensis]|uniref:Uncharacterized protein n=1 Tax=Kineosporia babensis TaxID=499548 RepID=A0A9X1NEZ5_9ACTN|nr:hypothetical protein [Kineosporia babensis]MCD5312585.1 hypothetical protein [Kineosporia babensis]